MIVISSRHKWVGLLLLVTLALRAYALDRPLLGNFATKNAVYAMIARNLAEGNSPCYRPTVDVLRGGDRGWHLLEIPLPAYLAGGLWKLFGGNLDVWGRCTSLFFSVLSVLALYVFVCKRWNPRAALAAAFLLAVSPVSIIYGQSFQLESSVACLSILSCLFLEFWLDRRGPGWLLALAGTFAALLLTKIYMAVLAIPLLARLGSGTRGQPARDRLRLILPALFLGIVAAAPAAAWLTYVWRISDPAAPIAERVYYSLRDSRAKHEIPHPLLTSGDFYRRLATDFVLRMVTPVGAILMLLGIRRRETRELIPWILSTLLLVLAMPDKFFRMNYYLLVILPPYCIVCGLGWDAWCQRSQWSLKETLAAALVTIGLSLPLVIRPAFESPADLRGVVEAGEFLDQIAADADRVITLHGTSIELLYYTHRPGWAIDPEDQALDQKIASHVREGARWIVAAGSEESLESLAQKLPRWHAALIERRGDWLVALLPKGD